MTTELNDVTERKTYLILLINCVSAAISVYDLSGTFLREMINKHIALCIVSFIIFQSLYCLSAVRTEGKYTCRYRQWLIMRSCDINAKGYSIQQTNSWHVSVLYVEVLLDH
jgi:hypothetical protein